MTPIGMICCPGFGQAAWVEMGEWGGSWFSKAKLEAASEEGSQRLVARTLVVSVCVCVWFVQDLGMGSTEPHK